MKLRAIFLLVVSACLMLAAVPASAAEVTGYRGDLMNDLNQLEQKIVGLAEAIPADKYSWRPSDGVRSVSEALMHTASANFFFPTQVGMKPPSDVNMAGLEKITDKDEVVATLKKSFAQLKKMVEAVDPAQLTETKKVFGQDMTYAGILHAAASHCHEHLGQMIAYARSIGVTPPWSQQSGN